jgi:hypothetical protein
MSATRRWVRERLNRYDAGNRPRRIETADDRDDRRRGCNSRINQDALAYRLARPGRAAMTPKRVMA